MSAPGTPVVSKAWKDRVRFVLPDQGSNLVAQLPLFEVGALQPSEWKSRKI
jgi:hypothetical protein